MILEIYWKTLEDANQQLVLRFEKLKKARRWRSARHRASPYGILKALQILYTDAQNAVSQPMRFKS
ncbi:hypothetical protein F4Z99_20235 [Candidatus Poribacteria bacterium]|nr:hypothetical protein [Candidatus Poribacteria bacterium]MYA99331.1 hypothetical protein [Candidatus Poribacteria bacterium]